MQHPKSKYQIVKTFLLGLMIAMTGMKTWTVEIQVFSWTCFQKFGDSSPIIICRAFRCNLTFYHKIFL